MSTRVIASVGVVLCVAMTSFSIYLGVIEHVYTHQTTFTHVLASPQGRQLICEKVQPSNNTTTTNGTVIDKNVTCPSHASP
jgi:hypothetical protein